MFAVVRPRNERGVATARRVGMEWVGETDKYYDLTLQVFRLRKGDLDISAPRDEYAGLSRSVPAYPETRRAPSRAQPPVPVLTPPAGAGAKGAPALGAPVSVVLSGGDVASVSGGGLASRGTR